MARLDARTYDQLLAVLKALDPDTARYFERYGQTERDRTGNYLDLLEEVQRAERAARDVTIRQERSHAHDR